MVCNIIRPQFKDPVRRGSKNPKSVAYLTKLIDKKNREIAVLKLKYRNLIGIMATGLPIKLYSHGGIRHTKLRVRKVA